MLLTVGRLDERKGHDTIIASLPKILQREPDAVYLIVGKGRTLSHLQKLAKENGVEDKVIFAGYVPDEDLPDYYRLCDVFILANRITEKDTTLAGDVEGFGIVFVEANSTGKPVIGCHSGGVVESVEDGKTGILVEPGNSEAIADAVIQLFGDEDKRKKMGEYGRERAVEKFEWDKLSKQIEKLL